MLFKKSIRVKWEACLCDEEDIETPLTKKEMLRAYFKTDQMESIKDLQTKGALTKLVLLTPSD